jgi:2-polyprenyl-3-methyl-5-hydroxy-6-metoxy-1,4-benzoquinol methylase
MTTAISEEVIEREVVTACPVCGREELTFLFHCRDRLHPSPGQFGSARCSCGVGVLTPRPTAAELGRYYPEDYGPYGKGAGGPTSTSPIGRRVFSKGARVVSRLLRDNSRTLSEDLRRDGPGSVLDVGFGDGRHLKLDSDAGWETFGVDFSPTAVEQARQRGVKAAVGTIDDVEAESGSFDLIRMSHVIEHVPDPEETLRRAHMLLRPGGRLHVATPNFESPTERLLGTYWYGLDAPRHLVLFTPSALASLAERVGLVVREIRHEVAPSDFSASVQRWAAARPRLRGLVRGRSLKHSLVLRTLLYPLWWALARRGRSERFHMVLVRPNEPS